MHKRMIVALPILLASTSGMAGASETERKMSRLLTADDPAKTTSVKASPLAPVVGQAAAPRPLLPPGLPPGSNTVCSGVCAATDVAFTTALHGSGTKPDTPTATVQPDTGTEPLARPCGPSPLSATQVETMVERVATAQGVEPQLAKAVAWAESRYDRVRNSPKGARGPMQLMPATASQLGVTDICDPHANIDAGVRHLKQLLSQFGNPLLAIAAYNAGSRAVIDHKGIPPFAETRDYVARVVNRQLGLLPATRETVVELTTAGGLSQAIPQGHGPGAAPHRFINGVMHLPSHGGFR